MIVWIYPEVNGFIPWVNIYSMGDRLGAKVPSTCTRTCARVLLEFNTNKSVGLVFITHRATRPPVEMEQPCLVKKSHKGWTWIFVSPTLLFSPITPFPNVGPTHAVCEKIQIFIPFNPLTAKLFNLNFHSLEVVSR